VESERPSDLKPADLQEYEMQLDETAFPFEEKAINVHEKNMELLHAGVFNSWTEKSLSKLAELMPGRYAKRELSSGFLDALDSYVYKSPASQIAPPQAPAVNNTDTPPAVDKTDTPPAVDKTDTPPAVDEGEVKDAKPK
jgi:hypothetical protein